MSSPTARVAPPTMMVRMGKRMKPPKFVLGTGCHIIPDATVPAASAAFAALCFNLAPGSTFCVEFTGVAIYPNAPVPSVWLAHKAVSDSQCRMVELGLFPPV